MRNAIGFGLGLLILLPAIWWVLPSGPGPLDVAPAGIEAVLVLNRVPESLDFLSQTRLAGQIDREEMVELAGRLSESAAGDWLRESREWVDSAAFIVFELTPREPGTYRVGFGLVLEFRPLARLRMSTVARQIAELAAGKFREDGEVVIIQEPVLVVRGVKPGQVLFLEEARDLLLISNQEEYRRQLAGAARGQAGRLVDDPGFQLGLQKVSPASDLFLYARGQDRFGLIPRFLWGLELEGGAVKESYFELPR